MIMAIDPSLTSCGVIVIDYKNNVLLSKTFGYTISARGEKDKIKRYLDISKEIILIGKSMEIDFVAIEGLGFKQKGNGMGNQIFLAELSGVIKSQIFLSLKHIPIIVPPASWKKLIIGSGRADKKQVKQFFTESGYKFDKQDLYDALGIAFYIRRIKTKAIDGRVLSEGNKQISN